MSNEQIYLDFSEPPLTFDVTIYGNSEYVTDTISKTRVRIFYKGMNRNRTYISEDFANQLIASLPYAPIKGIFNKDSLDYEDHGEDNTDGRIYGVVPENPNFAWEDHLDTDGVTRTYACADVYLFTGLYPEAQLVPGKSQSMEIYRKTLKGEWRLSEEDGRPYYMFLKGCLVGLQALGDDVEPCFEGSAFFTQIKDLQAIAAYIQNFTKKEESKKMEMDKTLFRLSDHEKADILFDLINPNFNEEGGWQLTGIVTEVYDDYALSVGPNGYNRTYYTKEGDSITLGETVPVKIVDATETEYAALETMKAIGGSFEAAQTAYTEATEKVETLEAAAAEFETTKTELEGKITTLETAAAEFETQKSELEAKIAENETATAEFNSKIEAYEAEKVELNNKINDITNENTVLAEFKKNVETEQKKAILDKYEEYLSETAITDFNSKIDEFSVEDFKKEVCTAAVENDPTIFSKRHDEPDMYFKGNVGNNKGAAMGGALALLEKRFNGGNK